MLEKGEGPVLSPEAWVEGKPQTSIFAGLNLKGKAVYDVVTFRCTACGYLDSYATSKQ